MITKEEIIAITYRKDYPDMNVVTSKEMTELVRLALLGLEIDNLINSLETLKKMDTE